MEKIMRTNNWNYFNRLTCTLFVVLGLLGIFASTSQAARRETTAPTVSITSPTTGTIFTSPQTVRISAAASDKSGIRNIDFYDGSTLLKNDTTSPYYFDWAITSANNGSHSLTAKAYDTAGNMKTSTAVTVTINIPVPDLTAPTVAFTSPTAATTYLSAQTVTIAANASDNAGVSKVDFYNGATLLKNDTTSPYDVAWAITSANNGNHNLTAKAYDAAGNSTVSTVAVTVNIPVPDLTAPTVALTSPASGTTFSSAQTVTISASASDNIGVNKVDLYSGTTLVSTDTTSPYSFAWTISSANNGNHSLTVKAYDAAGNSTVSSAVTVTVNIPVQNLSAPTVSLTSPTAGTTFTTAQTVRIAASATSSTGVSKVDIYNGTTLLKNDTTSPYYFDWAITSANNGNHNLTAKAYDAAGNSTVSTVAVTVNIPVQNLSTPTVSLTSPTAGTTFTTAQTVRIAASATSSTGVSKVDFYNGTTLLKNDTTSPYYFDWAITSANNGSHSLTAKVYDTAGNSTVSAAGIINVQIETIVSTATVFYGYDKNAGANDDPYAAPYGGISRYVDPSKGVNSGNGSISSPWKDMQYALTHATAGDSIYLRGGVHNYGITINGNVAATQLKPVEVRSYPGEWAIIDGSNIANGNLVRLFNESWIIFKNFEVRYSDKTKVSNGIYAENLTDCEFHNIYMHNNNGAGFSAKELYRVKFYNCSATNNVDIQTSGDSADGFSVTSGDNNAFYRCVATGNSDDGYDFWAASKHYLEDCIAATNGSGTGGDGNGFKLGKPDPAPYAGLRGGYHTLVRCISLKNRFRGYSENATINGSTLTGCIAYNSGQNWELPSAAHKVTNGISFDGNGDKIGSSTTVTASKGQGFSGTVYVSDFESVNIVDMNNQTAGQRFFYAVRNLF